MREKARVRIRGYLYHVSTIILMQTILIGGSRDQHYFDLMQSFRKFDKSVCSVNPYPPPPTLPPPPPDNARSPPVDPPPPTDNPGSATDSVRCNRTGCKKDALQFVLDFIWNFSLSGQRFHRQRGEEREGEEIPAVRIEQLRDRAEKPRLLRGSLLAVVRIEMIYGYVTVTAGSAVKASFNVERCSYLDHHINPYGNREMRIIFSTWDLDHGLVSLHFWKK